MNKTDYLKLPHTLSDGVIIQRNKPVVFSGKDRPGQPVLINWNGMSETAETDEKGCWRVTFPPVDAGGPYKLTVEGSSVKEVNDTYVGEVWLIGGQSNMELPVNRTYDEFKEEIDSANFPLIRQFHVEMDLAFQGPKDMMEQGTWKTATQENIQDFSSLGFFYAKKLHEELNVPVGIIHTAVGGTPIEAWMKEETLRHLGNYDEELDYWKDPDNVKAEVDKDLEINKTWYTDLNSNDLGLISDVKWYEEDIDLSGWKDLPIPVMFKDTEDLAEFCGVVWFRKTFTVTDEDMTSDSFRLRLGSLINGDETYLNGKKVGETGYRYPPRKYVLEKEDFKSGENTLVIRLSIDAANGGFIPSFPYQLELEHKAIDLTGDWHFKIGYEKDPIDPMLFLHYKPSVLYNAMIHPLRHSAVRGFLYYQGESNTGQPTGYKDLMKLMIADWRELFQEELPFYYVQLANYIDPAGKEDDHQWAVLRYEQDRARLENEQVEMIPAYDCGISYELHPHDKKTLAHRLAAVALNRDYHITDPYMNLEVNGVRLSENGVEVSVRGINGNLKMTEELPEIDIELKGLWIEVETVQIRENRILIPLTESLDAVTGVRYAWRNDPEGVIYDEATRLPLLPFTYPIN
ncbi:sialate O-acetylesterase [Alkalibacterium pelagium]|uniref:Sialate O-acetylesterase n=1 Tax=Alkalibacterium pelagium TaxID=426702 RepID=A0A1H7HFF4_9LACT|nr:sialate O-acetylesterase [Alkalibacterium pelagium]GEN50471.1 9-O-acetylesterase [Alkalibacterium pelagium]SEK48437.1 sialate O-acetylesterase [Alkalibacterium pelagium]